MRRYGAIPLAAVLLLYSWGGCASGRSDLLARYDALPYRDTFVYSGRTTDVTRAIVDAMADRGGVVTMVDHRTGIVTAEIESGDVLPEEAHASADKNDETLVTAIFAGIVAVFVFLILFGWLGDGCGSSDDDESSGDDESQGERRGRRHPHDREWEEHGEIIIVDPDIPVVKGFRYTMTFTITPDRFEDTRVRIRSLRHELKNGVVVRTTNVQNKYLCYTLDEAIRANLSRQ